MAHVILSEAKDLADGGVTPPGQPPRRRRSILR